MESNKNLILLKATEQISPDSSEAQPLNSSPEFAQDLINEISRIQDKKLEFISHFTNSPENYLEEPLEKATSGSSFIGFKFCYMRNRAVSNEDYAEKLVLEVLR